MKHLSDAEKKRKRLFEGVKYSKADVRVLKEVFERHDQDHNGRVTMGELMEALSTEKNLYNMELSAFRTIDLNHDGVLTFGEYLRRLFPYATERELACMMEWAYPTKAITVQEHTFEPSEEQLEEIRKIFKMYDVNKNSVIDWKELISLSDRCGYDAKDMESLFSISDKDSNGTISLDEFVQLMKVSYM